MPPVSSSSNNSHASSTMPSSSSQMQQNPDSGRIRIGNREQSPPKPLPPIPYDVTIDIDTFIHTPEGHHNLRATNKHIFQQIQEDDGHAFQKKWDAFSKNDSQDHAHALKRQSLRMSFDKAYDAVFSTKTLEEQIQILKAFSTCRIDDQTFERIFKLIRHNPEARAGYSFIWDDDKFLSFIAGRYLYLTQTTAADEASPTSFLDSLKGEDFVELCTFVRRQLRFFTHDQFSLFQSHIHRLDKNYAHLHQVCQKALKNADNTHYTLLELLPIQEQSKLIKEIDDNALSGYVDYLPRIPVLYFSPLDVFFEDEAFDRLLRYAKNMGENHHLREFFECLMAHPQTEQVKTMIKQILIDGNHKAFCEYMMIKQILIDGNHKAFSEYMWALQKDNNFLSFTMDIFFEKDTAISDRLLKYVKNMGENHCLRTFFKRLMDHPQTEQAKAKIKQILIGGNDHAFCEYIWALVGDNLPSLAMDILLEDKAVSNRLLKYAKNMGENHFLRTFFERLMDHPQTERAKAKIKQILKDGNNKAFCEYIQALTSEYRRAFKKDNNPPPFAMDILFEEKEVLDRFFTLHAQSRLTISELLETILYISQRDKTETIGGKRIEALIKNSNLLPEAYQEIERDYLISHTNDLNGCPVLREALRQALDKKLKI